MKDPNQVRIVITGSRNWPDDESANAIRGTIARQVDMSSEIGRFLVQTLCTRFEDIVIVHGGAKGVDSIADALARRMGLKVEVFHAEWDKHGKKAGPIRNRAMLDAGADIVLAFPIGGPSKSPGTWDCLMDAATRGVPVVITPRDVKASP